MSSTTTPWIGAGSGGQTGDALHAVLCAAAYNIRWLLRAIVRLKLRGLFMPLFARLAQLIQTLVMIHRETITGPEQQLCAAV